MNHNKNKKKGSLNSLSFCSLEINTYQLEIKIMKKSSILQHFTEQEYIKSTSQQVYDNVWFPNGFNVFLESLLVEQITTEYPKCTTKNGVYRWINELNKSGIILETTSHPYLNNNCAGSITVTGHKDTLKIFKNIMERHNVEYNNEPRSSRIQSKVEYHDTLNPKLWEQEDNEYRLHDDVKSALIAAVNEFFAFLEMPELPVEDITLTGSSANYNWTSSSDLDIHLVVDMDKATDKYGKIAVQYFDMCKKVWNDLHDIHIKNIPVEFYVQSLEEEHNSTGIYSIQNENWVAEPKYEEPDVDNNAVKAKIKEWTHSIQEIIGSNKADAIGKLMKKLGKLRQAGLDSGGEFSAENIAFKYLRNQGYLDKLADCKNKAFDRELSIEEEEYWNIFN
ncbi:MAG: hypothetical protein ACXW2E_01415 [Nitrososphaeraceae archaeon]